MLWLLLSICTFDLIDSIGTVNFRLRPFESITDVGISSNDSDLGCSQMEESTRFGTTITVDDLQYNVK